MQLPRKTRLPPLTWKEVRQVRLVNEFDQRQIERELRNLQADLKIWYGEVISLTFIKVTLKK